MKRLFDILFSLLFIVVLMPLLLVLAVMVACDGPGGVFFMQTRIGKDHRPFRLMKFRTMKPASEKSGQLTIGARDSRITKTGYFLRKYKIDELPQLFNILVGDMSVVGPRPEVPRYVNLYNEEQKRVLSIKPGLTDYASLEYFNESELLAKSSDPERTYIEEVMPAKLNLNLKYVAQRDLKTDLIIIWRTVEAIFKS
jgi:lipopolysaccharide/colanic/teichoic acid biosynthesis glycosyltransferase